jgi:hypothetical protein
MMVATMARMRMESSVKFPSTTKMNDGLQKKCRDVQEPNTKNSSIFLYFKGTLMRSLKNAKEL